MLECTLFVCWPILRGSHTRVSVFCLVVISCMDFFAFVWVVGFVCHDRRQPVSWKDPYKMARLRSVLT